MHNKLENLRTSGVAVRLSVLSVCSLGALLPDSSNKLPVLTQLRQDTIRSWTKESNSLCTFFFLKGDVLVLCENKTCCGVWNNADGCLVFWYQYFHMLNMFNEKDILNFLKKPKHTNGFGRH